MKKRILSLILALSMVLSVLPLGAFAEGSNQELVMEGGFPVGSNNGTANCDGDGWWYRNGILYLNAETYDFSYINPQTKAGGSTKQPVLCEIEIQLGVTITGGTFNATVYNGKWNSPGGTISNGIFNGGVTNSNTIEKGTFNGEVANESTGTISDGTFNGGVTNRGIINNGTFAADKEVKNWGTIEKGTFEGSVINYATISDGTFNGKVSNRQGGSITNGTFNYTVENVGGGISNGTFTHKVENNDNGTIFGGTFAGGVNNSNDGNILGGVINGYIDVLGVGVYPITVHEASPDAKIEKVNDVSAVWDPYVVVMKGNALPEVTVTASTEIFSLNDQPLSTNPYNSRQDSTDKNTVTFTMQEGSVIIGCGGLIMTYDGYPVSSNNGNADCKGKGWSYDKNTKTLTLTDGTFNFNSTYPQNPNNGRGAKPVACAVETRLRVEITGGTFEGEVINNDLGVISGGTFHEKVSNSNGMITGGTFKSSVTSNGHGRIFGGVFNGNATLTNVTGLHSITVASGAKIKEVNGMSADWDPYVVVTENATTNEVIITADTEIFSLNGKSIGDGNCKSSYDGSDYKTVKFTMPDDKDVVLNGAITCTDLVMEKGWPQASNEGTISCEGTGWSYDHNTKTLTLTSGEYDFSSTEPVACAIQSSATITGGTFEKKVTNNAGGIISGGTFQDTCSVTNEGTIKNGTFKNVCSVTNNKTIENGTFKNMCRVINNSTIENGTFKNMCSVENNGTINNGTFTYKVENNGIITGGVFNRNANLTGVTGGYNITVASNAKIEKVNGVSADWAPYVVTSNATPTTKEVTITADTEIFSLNGQPIAESSYGSDKTTVTFTMPDDDVVLNKAITSTDLVMEKGYPKDSNGGKTPCKGDGWEYIPNDPTNGDMLLLTGSNQTGGLYDFSTIGDGSAVECNVFVGKPTAITGGEFNGKVFNNSGILGGTFHGEVDNMGPGRIENGTFKNSVENNGMIENGTFEGTVENNTNGTISGGTFAGSVSNNGGTVNGGIFNGNTGLDEVTGLHSITWDAASSNAKIEKVNGVSADWKPYVVTSNATTKEVTITAPPTPRFSA